MPHTPERPTDEPGDVRYEDLLRAVGNYIDQHGYSDVLVTQLPDGVLLKGTVIDRSAAAPVERIDSVVFSGADLLELVADSERRRSAGGGSGSPSGG
jgi:hypothetical protein